MKSKRIAVFLVAAATVLAAQTAVAANLLRNGSFEQTPCVTPCNQAPGYMPSEWTSLVLPSSDSYSNDGSYGLAPDSYNNFIGVTAQDGIRWVAAYTQSYYVENHPEFIAQVLSAPLVAGNAYTLSGYVHRATVKYAAHHGTYQIELWDSTDFGANKIVLGTFGHLSHENGWQLRTLTFTAPAQAATYPVLVFRPQRSGGDKGANSYPALDNVTLVPAAVAP